MHFQVCAYRNNHDVVLQEDLVSIWGGGPIGTLSNDLEETKNKHFTLLQPSYPVLNHVNTCEHKAQHCG